MNIREIKDRVLFALSVPKCICCNERLDYEQKAFCPKCSTDYEDFKTRNCSRCAKILQECSCSNEYLRGHFISKTVKSFRYMVRDDSKPANSLIFSLKKDNRQDVLDVCADEMLKSIENCILEPQNYVITNVPRRKSAIIEYGIDHSALLAEEVAKRLGTRYIPLLKSNSKKAQKSLEHSERMKNVNFDLIKNVDLSGKSVIIVDDVITSGASMGSAAALIRSLGCRNIVAASLGIAYKDS